jgi:hypothetical protein
VRRDVAGNLGILPSARASLANSQHFKRCYSGNGLPYSSHTKTTADCSPAAPRLFCWSAANCLCGVAGKPAGAWLLHVTTGIHMITPII